MVLFFCKMCIQSLIGGNVKREIEISETDLRMILDARLAKSPDGVDGVIQILGKQGFPLTLARIPSRKQSKAPLGLRQIKNRTTRMRELETIVLADPEERKKRRVLEIKLNPQEWKTAFSEAKVKFSISLEDQGELIRNLQQNHFSDSQIINLQKLYLKVTGDKMFTHARRSTKEISSAKKTKIKYEIETGTEKIKIERKKDKIERSIQWWRVGNVEEVIQNWINSSVDRLYFHTSQQKDKLHRFHLGPFRRNVGVLCCFVEYTPSKFTRQLNLFNLCGQRARLHANPKKNF